MGSCGIRTALPAFSSSLHNGRIQDRFELFDEIRTRGAVRDDSEFGHDPISALDMRTARRPTVVVAFAEIDEVSANSTLAAPVGNVNRVAVPSPRGCFESHIGNLHAWVFSVQTLKNFTGENG